MAGLNPAVAGNLVPPASHLAQQVRPLSGHACAHEERRPYGMLVEKVQEIVNRA